ncbi:hypothetical protein D3C80_1862840 [compost metagenome]
MQTFDQALFDLVVEGAIPEDEAIKNADSANNLRLKLKLYRENPATAASAPAAAAAAPVAAAAPTPAPSRTEDAASWGLELKLEDLEDDAPEVPGPR